MDWIEFERTRRVVGSSYARRNCDNVTLALMERLESEGRALRAENDRLLREQRLKTGRWVFGRAIAMGILILPVLFFGFWMRESKGESALELLVNTASNYVATAVGRKEAKAPAPPTRTPATTPTTSVAP